tara:strand:- start:768 stop:1109 length:342 start_codon:yes stop_codon:yes gene_type:complete
MNDKKINIKITDNDMNDEIKEQIKDADQVHIHKTTDDGEEVDIDINKNNKTVEVNVDKNGKKNKVKIGLSGIKVEDDDGEKVNIQFIPIFLFALAVLGGFLFFVYKVLELIFR